ncbi:hypothetical protein, partial [Lactobacillus nasalidis]
PFQEVARVVLRCLRWSMRLPPCWDIGIPVMTAIRKMSVSMSLDIRSQKLLFGYIAHIFCSRANRLEYETTLRHERKLGIDEGRKQGIDEGIDKTIVKSALSVMTKLNVSAEQALDVIDVPKSDQPKYLKLMKEKA